MSLGRTALKKKLAREKRAERYRAELYRARKPGLLREEKIRLKHYHPSTDGVHISIGVGGALGC